MKTRLAIAGVLVALLGALGCGGQERGDGPQGDEKNPVAWKTATVSLEAEDFHVFANGKHFYGTPQLTFRSDPGDADYTTLEVKWQEHDVAMRVYMYFTADGSHWWADEMRTYDGQADSDWIYYTGTFFKSALGATYSGNLELTDPATGAKLYFSNLKLQAFL
jgi:hypothetical protein